MQCLRNVWRSPFQRIGTLALVLAGTALAPRSAGAFCQTHTCEFSGTQMCTWDAAAGCWTGGAIAHWNSSCVQYAVQRDGSKDENISADALAGVLDEGFRIWSDVECGGGLTPELTASYRGLTSCDQVEFNCAADEDNDNVVLFRDGPDLPSTTIALSTVIANTSTGQILDVDIEINSHDFDFYIDPAKAKTKSDAHDLRLVLNHELGHFLGLSHTLAPGALMRAAYDGFGELPAPDDIAGMCSSSEQSATDPECAVTPSSGACVGSDATCPPEIQKLDGGCSLAWGEGNVAPGGQRRPGGSRLAAGWLLGAGLLLLARSGSKRRQRPS